MNPLLILLITVVAFALAAKYYAGFIHRNLGSDDARETPAVSKADGRDFVPTPTHVVFAHHFASIAGAGPILGPLIAAIYGWAPAWGWLLVGCVFFGAVHDYTALFISMREGGRSMAGVAERFLGKAGFGLFIAFTIIMLLLVTATFLNLSAGALMSRPSAAKIGLAADQTLFRTAVENGEVKAQVGGISSMSIIVITMFAPLVGWLYLRRRLNVWLCSLLAVGICALSVVVGFLCPVTLDGVAGWLRGALPEGMAAFATAENVWKLLLALYTLLAAGIPVWIVLQSRDFINVHILYAGMALLIAGVVGASLRGMTMVLPASSIAEGTARLGYLWPALFITIACGAISGFHSLCAGGTSCKQVTSESGARVVGYYAMLLEGLLGVLVLCVVCMGLTPGDYLSLVHAKGAGATTQALAFGLAVGNVVHAGLRFIPVAIGTVFAMLILEGFLITTLDTAVRLNRYLFEELWGALFRNPPRLLRHYWFNSALAVALMLVFAFNSSALSLWALFATSNQLLAALVLGVVTFWLVRQGRRFFYTLIPAVLMLATTVTMLVLQLVRFLRMPALADPRPVPWNLVVADVAIIGLTVGLVAISLKGSAAIVRERRAARAHG